MEGRNRTSAEARRSAEARTPLLRRSAFGDLVDGQGQHDPQQPACIAADKFFAGMHHGFVERLTRSFCQAPLGHFGVDDLVIAVEHIAPGRSGTSVSGQPSRSAMAPPSVVLMAVPTVVVVIRPGAISGPISPAICGGRGRRTGRSGRLW